VGLVSRADLEEFMREYAPGPQSGRTDEITQGKLKQK
jgi:hypothetical protein